MSPGAFSEDQLVEQPAIQLFAELGWETLSAADEVMGVSGTLGREFNRSSTERKRAVSTTSDLNSRPNVPETPITSSEADNVSQPSSAKS